MAELKLITGMDAEPDFVKIYRHERAIPQYTVGHFDKLQRLQEILTRHEGLYITGNSLKGISVNDCVENSFKLAGKIIEEAG